VRVPARVGGQVRKRREFEAERGDRLPEPGAAEHLDLDAPLRHVHRVEFRVPAGMAAEFDGADRVIGARVALPREQFEEGLGREQVGRRLAAEATELCAAAARDGQPRAVIEGGEAVVTVPPDHGVGGRNQQTVLAAVEAWRCVGDPWPTGLVITSIGTDGEDGPTDAAGGIADDDVVQRLSDAGIDVARAVARCDAYPALATAGGLIRTGPTGTNVADVRMILARS